MLPKHYPDNELILKDVVRHYDEIAGMDTDFGKMMSEQKKRGLESHNMQKPKKSFVPN